MNEGEPFITGTKPLFIKNYFMKQKTVLLLKSLEAKQK